MFEGNRVEGLPYRMFNLTIIQEQHKNSRKEKYFLYFIFIYFFIQKLNFII